MARSLNTYRTNFYFTLSLQSSTFINGQGHFKTKPDDRHSISLTTHVKVITQLAVFIRGVKENSQLVKELLELVPMKGKMIVNPLNKPKLLSEKNGWV
jgi:hypothetical protein